MCYIISTVTRITIWELIEVCYDSVAHQLFLHSSRSVQPHAHKEISENTVPRIARRKAFISFIQHSYRFIARVFAKLVRDQSCSQLLSTSSKAHLQLHRWRSMVIVIISARADRVTEFTNTAASQSRADHKFTCT